MPNLKRNLNRGAFSAVFVLIIFVGSVYLFNKNKNSSTSESNKIKILNNQPLVTSEQKDLAGTANQGSESKSTIDQKASALKAVEDELKISPDNELLKGRRDVLLNDWLSDSNQATPKE